MTLKIEVYKFCLHHMPSIIIEDIHHQTLTSYNHRFVILIYFCTSLVVNAIFCQKYSLLFFEHIQNLKHIIS